MPSVYGEGLRVRQAHFHCGRSDCSKAVGPRGAKRPEQEQIVIVPLIELLDAFSASIYKSDNCSENEQEDAGKSNLL